MYNDNEHIAEYFDDRVVFNDGSSLSYSKIAAVMEQMTERTDPDSERMTNIIPSFCGFDFGGTLAHVESTFKETARLIRAVISRKGRFLKH